MPGALAVTWTLHRPARLARDLSSNPKLPRPTARARLGSVRRRDSVLIATYRERGRFLRRLDGLGSLTAPVKKGDGDVAELRVGRRLKCIKSGMHISPPDIPIGSPYCGSCGYALVDLSDASKCPECGKPLVEVLMRKTAGGAAVRAVRIKSETTVFGWPLYHIAFGARMEYGESYGLAKGVVAIGDGAIGGVAIGGAALGVIAIGGGACGLVSLGGAAVGLFGALGGGAVGAIAVGGGAIGVCATGGGAVGVVAQGGGVYGLYARGPGASGTHVISPQRGLNDPAAVEMFRTLAPIMGPNTPLGFKSFAQTALGPFAIAGVLLVIISLCVLVAKRSSVRS